MLYVFKQEICQFDILQQKLSKYRGIIISQFKQKKMMEQQINTDRSRIQRKIIKVCVQLGLIYKNFRINHGFLLVVLIWSRVAFGVALNIFKISNVQNSFFLVIKQYAQIVSLYMTNETLLVFHIVILSFISISSFLTLVFIFKDNSRYKKFSILYILAISTMNCLLSRYLLRVLTMNYSHNFLAELQILCSIILLFSILFQAAFWTISTSSNAKTNNLLICQKTSFIFKKQFLNYFIAILVQINCIIFQSKYEGIKIFVTVLHLLLSLVSLYWICKEYIYHNEYVQKIYMVATCFETSLCLVALISLITKQKLFIDNMILVIIGLVSFLYLGSKQYMEYRNHQIVLKQIEESSQAKIYLHILQASLNSKSSSMQVFDFILNIQKNQHQEQCKTSDCMCKKSNKYFEQYSKFLVKNKLNKIKNKLMENFQVVLLCCYIKLNYYKIFPDLMNNVYQFTKIQNLTLFQIIQYQSFKFQVRNFLDTKKTSSSAIQTQKIQKQDLLIVQFSSIMKKFSSTKLLFWSNLVKKIPILSNFQKPLKQHYIQFMVIQKLLAEITKNFIYSRVLLNFIILYQIYIRLNTSLTNNLKQAIKNIQKISLQESKILKQKNFNFDLIMFEDRSTIFQSKVQQNNMGIIHNVSKNVKQVFGFNCQSIIGLNINQIMPKSMQKQHDSILQSWRDRASWANIHKLRFVFAVCKDLTCFSSAIYLRLVQRQQSINILATFVKANQNDYMLVNQQGIIEGIGINLKKLLGQKISKIPFSFICENGNEIIKEVKRTGEKKTKILEFFHIKGKGVQQMVSSYHENRHKLQTSNDSNILTSRATKSKQRSTKLMVTYYPYKMGKLFYVIFKYISDKQTNLMFRKQLRDEQDAANQNECQQLDHQNTQKTQYFQAQNSEKQLKDMQQSSSMMNRIQQQKNLNICEFKQSVQTSNNQNYMSNQNVFLYLHERINSNKGTLNKQTSRLCSSIVVIFALLLILFTVQKTQQSGINQKNNELMNESILFYQKFNRLILVYNRFLNVKDETIDRKLFTHNLNIINKQIHKISALFQKQNRQIWMTSKVRQKMYNSVLLNKQLNWNQVHEEHDGLNNKRIIIFEQFFYLYLRVAQQIQKFYHKQVGTKQLITKTLQDISANNKNLKIFIDQNIQIIKSSITGSILQKTILSRVVYGTFLLVIFIISFIMWKLRRIQKYQLEAIIDIFLHISDRNCQLCVTYFSKINKIFSECFIKVRESENKPLFLQDFLIRNTHFRQNLDAFQIQKDKMMRRKTATNVTKQQDIKKWIGIVVLIMAIVATVKWDQQQKYQILQNQFLNSVYQLADGNKQQNYKLNIIKMISINKYVENGSQGDDGDYLDFFMRQIKNDVNVNSVGEKAQVTTDSENIESKFLKFIQISKQMYIDPWLLVELQQITNMKICTKIKQIDSEYYSQLCAQNSQYKVQIKGMRIFEIQTTIREQKQQHIQFLFNEKVSKSNNSGRENNYIIQDEVLYIGNMYLSAVFQSIDNIMANSNQNRDYIVMYISVALLVLAIIAVGIVVWYSHMLNLQMNQNLWSITIVPENILKYTKGSIKCIEVLLNKQ